MKVKEAKELTGGLSDPSKMPGKGYSLPALEACPVGRKLSENKDTICRSCYACRGRYLFSNVKESQRGRMRKCLDPLWPEAMRTLISREKCRHFRWHDSGDIFCRQYWNNMLEVMKGLPDYKFFLPTNERTLLKEWVEEGGKVPENCVVRLSSVYPGKLTPVHDKLKNDPGILQCGVGTEGYDCPAEYHERYECGECRACWDRTIPVVSFHYR